MLFYSDMHGSTPLSQRLSTQDYIVTLNRYFDCVAGAVQDHGGEVLKFVGDGLLAVFPFDDRRRFPEDMCTAALSAAQEAFRRNKEASPDDQISFGIGLHVGSVVYGNVGTEKRLDFTVTGTSIALASRVEGLTRVLDDCLLATGDFAKLVKEGCRPLGSHTVRGIDEPVEVDAFDTPQ